MAFETLSVTVRSVANAGPHANRAAVAAMKGSNLIGVVSFWSSVEEEARGVGKAHGDDDQNSRDP